MDVQKNPLLLDKITITLKPLFCAREPVKVEVFKLTTLKSIIIQQITKDVPDEVCCIYLKQVYPLNATLEEMCAEDGAELDLVYFQDDMIP